MRNLLPPLVFFLALLNQGRAFNALFMASMKKLKTRTTVVTQLKLTGQIDDPTTRKSIFTNGMAFLIGAANTACVPSYSFYPTMMTGEPSFPCHH
jgi:hypothetical protein